jgi:hypothetical protein
MADKITYIYGEMLDAEQEIERVVMPAIKNRENSGHPMSTPSRIDFDSVPRCGAQTRAGTPSKHPGRMSNGPCRLHGEASKVNHGRYCKSTMDRRKRVCETVRELRLYERDPEGSKLSSAGIRRGINRT